MFPAFCKGSVIAEGELSAFGLEIGLSKLEVESRGAEIVFLRCNGNVCVSLLRGVSVLLLVYKW